MPFIVVLNPFTNIIKGDIIKKQNSGINIKKHTKRKLYVNVKKKKKNFLYVWTDSKKASCYSNNNNYLYLLYCNNITSF